MIEKTLLVDARFPLPARRLLGLVQQLTRLHHGQAEQLIRLGGAQVNGRCVRRLNHPLEMGDQLLVTYEPDELRPQEARASCHREMEIRFEDDHLLVVNKPPDLLTVPTPQGERLTLLSLLQKRLETPKGGASVFCVHRLDRGVSGLLVFAKRLEIAHALREQFAQRKPQRRYLALVHGTLAPAEGTIRSFLATDEQLNRYSCSEDEGGQLAVTHYRTLSVYPETSLVEVRLETGRRNQIRVHLAEAGNPVLGDPRYGRELPQHRHWTYRRIALHAELLGFEHPVSGEALEFRQPLPAEMQDFLQRARRSNRKISAPGKPGAARTRADGQADSRRPSVRDTKNSAFGRKKGTRGRRRRVD